MSDTYDLKLLESELAMSQHLNWVLDNIYQNYKQGFNSLKEILIMIRNGQYFHDKCQLQHYSTVVNSIEKNIALWENQYNMFDAKFRTPFNCHKEMSDLIEYEKSSSDSPIDVKPCISEQLMNGETMPSTNQSEDFDSNWYNDDMCYIKSLEILAHFPMEQLISTTLKDEMLDSGFDNSPLSINNCDDMSNFMVTNLVNDMENTKEIDKKNLLTAGHCVEVVDTDLYSVENGHNKKRNYAQTRKPRQIDTRIWYKCGWDGCSFGSFYNGVVKRHSYKKHSGKLKIDKSSNSLMHRFKCDWPGCEVSLVAYHKLVEHKRKHTGEKPFKCKYNECNYATARLYSMIIHERTHKLDPNSNID